MAEYQDEAYARLYDERLQRIKQAGGAAAQSETQAEVARWLALWMAFDDIVHVARLKLAQSRLQRVKREVKAKDDQVLKVYDHFKPGAAEFCCFGYLKPGPSAC